MQPLADWGDSDAVENMGNVECCGQQRKLPDNEGAAATETAAVETSGNQTFFSPSVLTPICHLIYLARLLPV